MRILIAEDDLTSRSMLAAVLKKSGHDVVETADGTEAWEALQRVDAPRLVILDWVMPGMDGVEVCRKLRQLETDCPPYVIMLTGQADRKHVVEGLEAGADDYVAKPFERAELKARVDAGARIVSLQERLANQATTDELTGLPNRRAGLEALGRELARSSREDLPLGVAILDVDHFKQVNDTHGHPAGDDVLRELAQRLNATLRPYDHLCRYGGEEFLLVSPGATDSAPWERLRAAVAGSPFPTRVGDLDVTVSIGHTEGDGQSDPEALIAAADRGLYRAKEAGRNRVEREDAGGGDVAPPQPSAHPAVAPAAVVPEVSSLAPQRNDADSTRPSRVLVVEDDLTSRSVLTAMLQKHGHEVVTACDGPEAWTILQRADAPRLVILDRLMPGMDGLEVCRKVRARHADRPPYVIMLTLLGDIERVVEGLDAGADDYVVKPFEPAELRARIEVGRRMLAMQDRLAAQNQELRDALSQIQKLRGFIPICMHCKKVRDDRDFWREVEDYVSVCTGVQFSHGLCPTCLEQHYPEEEEGD